MPILVECPQCRYRQSHQAKKCKKCGYDLARTRQKVYWIDYYVTKPYLRRRRERIGPWKQLAEQVLAKRKAEIAENRFLDKFEEPPEVTFSDLAKQYTEWCKANNRAVDTKMIRVRHLQDFFKDKLLTDITSWHVEKYKAERKKVVSESTVNKELTVLRHMMNKAIEWGYLQENPLKNVRWFREKRGRLRFLSAHEIAALLRECSKWLRPIVLFALNTGMRRGEIMSLTWDCVDFEAKVIYVTETKSGDMRVIPMNQVSETILRDLREQAGRDQKYVFVNPTTGRPWVNIRKPFMEACKAAGISDCTFHTLRHTFASQLVMKGIDLKTVSELLGHKNIQMTMRYAHLSPDHKRLSVESIQDFTAESLSISRRLENEKAPSEGDATSPLSILLSEALKQ